MIWREVCNSSYRSLFTPILVHLAEHFVLLSIFQMEFVCLPFMIYRSVPYFSVVHTVKVSISMFTKAQKSEKFSLNDMKSHDFLFGLFVIEATTFAYFEKLEKRPVNTKCTHPSKFWSRKDVNKVYLLMLPRVCKSFVANGHGSRYPSTDQNDKSWFIITS